MLANDVPEGQKTSLDVFEPRSRAPMPLGWEVDNEARIRQLSGCEYEHATWPDLLPSTGSGVRLKVLRIRALELQGDSASHVPLAIDGVDQCFGILLKDVSGLKLNHWAPPLEVPLRQHLN